LGGPASLPSLVVGLRYASCMSGTCGSESPMGVCPEATFVDALEVSGVVDVDDWVTVCGPTLTEPMLPPPLTRS